MNTKNTIKLWIKFFTIFLTIIYGFGSFSKDRLSVQIMRLREDKRISLEDLFSKLRASSNISLLIISNVSISSEKLFLKAGQYSINDILKLFCDNFNDHDVHVRNNTLIIRQKCFASNQAFQDSLKRKLILPHPNKMKLWELPAEPPEPQDTWSIPEDEITDEMRKELENDAKIFKENYPAIKREHMSYARFYVSVKMQRFCLCFHGKEGEWNVDVEKYQNIQLNEIFEDIVSSHSYWCWIHEFSDSAKDAILKQNLEAVKYFKEQGRDAEIDEGMLELLKPGPIYGIEIYKANYDPEEFDQVTEESFVKPEEEAPSIPDVPPVLDGMPLLKISSVFMSKKNLLSVSMKNTSGKPIEFKDFRKNFLVLELYEKTNGGPDFARAIYCGEKTSLPESFILAPGKTFDFDFEFARARFKENYGFPLLWKLGIENKVFLDKVPFQELKDVEKVITFYPIVHFDLDGKKYKSSGEEAMMKQE